MLEWLKKIINKILDFFWIKPEESIVEEKPIEPVEPKKPTEEEKEEPIKEEQEKQEEEIKEETEEIEENEDNEMNKNFYDCELVTGAMNDVECFSEENEACYTFFLPVGRDRETLPDLISILYTVDDNPDGGPTFDEMMPNDNPGRSCIITQLTMGKTMPSDEENGRYWYMMSAYNPRYEIVANYRGVIDCGDPGYPKRFTAGGKNLIKFTPQDYWLSTDMENTGYSIVLPFNVDGKVNFSAYLYFRD